MEKIEEVTIQEPPPGNPPITPRTHQEIEKIVQTALEKRVPQKTACCSVS